MTKIKLMAFGILVLVLLQNQINAAPGDLDTTFGSGGKLIISASGTLAGPYAAIKPDGSKYAIVATEFNSSGGVNMWMAKRNRDGTPDRGTPTGFSIVYDYLRDTDGTRLETYAYEVKILSSGKILVLTEGRREGFPVFFALTRFNVDGTIDTTFGIGGRTIFNGFKAYFVEIKPDGKIVVAGWIVNPTTFYDFGIAQLTSNGAFDTTFSGDGIASVDFFSSGDSPVGYFNGDTVTDLKIQPDGKIVLVGSVLNADETAKNIGMARLLKNGSLDKSFDFDGRAVWTDFSPTSARASIVVQSDGSLVVYSPESSGGAPTPRLVKFTASGAFVDWQYARPALYSYNGKIERQSDDKIVQIETPYNSVTRNDFGVARNNSDLSSDTTWGFSGDFVLADFTSPAISGFAYDSAYDIVIDSFNKALIVGLTQQGSGHSKVGLIRLLPD